MPWFSNNLVPNQVVHEKMSQLSNKVSVFILYPTTLSWRKLCDHPHVSHATNKGDLVFEQITSRTVFQNYLS